MDLSNVTRFEVIDHRESTMGHMRGRAFTVADVAVCAVLQDDGRTLKVFVVDASTEGE